MSAEVIILPVIRADRADGASCAPAMSNLAMVGFTVGLEASVFDKLDQLASARGITAEDMAATLILRGIEAIDDEQ